MNGTIMTFWEITEGELAESTGTHRDVPRRVVVRVSLCHPH